MIFIITPSLNDFKVVCGVKKLPVSYNFNGLITNKNIRWINCFKRLKETNVIPTQVYYGFRFEEFTQNEQMNIKIELEMRMIKR
jgi:hypothetical protein